MEAVNVDHKKEEKKVPKLRFLEFEKEWRYVRIQKLIDEKAIISHLDGNHGALYPRSEEFTNDGVPYVTANNFINGIVNLETCKYLPLERASQFKKGIAKDEDVLFAHNATVGPTALLKTELDYIILSTTATYFRCDNKHLLNRFLKFFFETAFFVRQYSRVMSQSTRNQVPITTQRTFFINLPKFLEQKKIASFISAVDQKIQQLTRKKELMEQYKKGMIQKIFSQEIRFKPALSEVEGDENGNDYPAWEEKQLSEFLIPTFREIPTPSKLYLAIGVRSHCRGTFQKPDSDPNAIAMDKLFVVKENDLIVNITFAWEGAIAMVKKRDDGGLVSHRFPTYTFDRSKVLSAFFKYVFLQKRFRYTLDLISPGGAGRNRVLSKKEFLKIKWTMPLIEEQKKIAEFFISIDNKIKTVQIQINQIQNFKKGLLQQMFV